MSIIKEGGEIEYPQPFKQVTAYTDETPVIASNSTTMKDNNEEKVKTAHELAILIRLLAVRSNTYNLFGPQLYAFEKSMLINLHKAWIFLSDAALESENTALKLEVEKMKDLLEECEIQIKYLHDKFKPTGTGNAVLFRIQQVLNEN